ncbi:MAG: multicopper oxidase domain-containing protein [Actinomycetota bacterium]
MRFKAALVAVMVGLVALGSVPTTASPRVAPRPQACDSPDRTETLYAEYKRPNSYEIGYSRDPGKGRIPGPILEMTEGECLAVVLVNNTKQKLSFHPHGLDYTVASDGSRLNNSCVQPGKSRTYVISTHGPGPRPDGTFDPGSAGYWHYHDHCLGTEHGTGGIDRGLYGALIVRRPGDPLPDRKRQLVMHNITFNLKRAPGTPTIRATVGERVEFIIITHGELMHTFHLHGHRWVDNRTGLLEGPDNTAQVIDNKTQGPGDSFGFQVVAGEHVGPGAWMYHCHIQSHSDIGMAGLFLVSDESGRVPPAAKRAVRAFEHGDHKGN